MVTIRENGAASGGGVLATFGYDDLGRRTSLTRGNGNVTSYAYDNVSRLSQLGHDLAGTANDLTLTFAYNPASQISSTTRSNDLYAWTGHGSGTTSTTADGLNRIAAWNGTIGYDARGNIASRGARTYTYTADNQLTAQPAVSSMIYDGLGRLRTHTDIAAGTQTGIDYDGGEAIAEYAGQTMLRRFVHGPGMDEPLVEYVGPSTSLRHFLHADERGSIVARSDTNGNASGTNRYDENGAPQGLLTSRFGFTGQMWLPATRLYYHKARLRDPALDRFLQTDRLGYVAGMNLYAYVAGDPVNATDPWGLKDSKVDRLPPKCISECGTTLKGGQLDGQKRHLVTGSNPTMFQDVSGRWYGYDAGGNQSYVSGYSPWQTGGLSGTQAGRERGSGGAIPGADEQPDQCSGTVRAEGVNFTGILALGVTVSFGRVTVNHSGASSWFFTAGVGAGLDAGLSGFASVYKDIKSFAGYADNVNAFVGFPGSGRSFGGSAAFDIDGNLVGGTAAGSGISDVSLGARIGASATATDTTLLSGPCS